MQDLRSIPCVVSCNFSHTNENVRDFIITRVHMSLGNPISFKKLTSASNCSQQVTTLVRTKGIPGFAQVYNHLLWWLLLGYVCISVKEN